MKNITVEETTSDKYPPRTFFNAKNADVTLAVAVDFSTAGEVLTAKAADGRLLQAHAGHTPLDIARSLWRHMEKHSARSINIAGNGIYTFQAHGWTQEQVDILMFDILKPIAERREITLIRTGGQTGADWSGAVAGAALGIPVVVTMPKGCPRKFGNGQTTRSSPTAILNEISREAERLLLKMQTNDVEAGRKPQPT